MTNYNRPLASAPPFTPYPWGVPLTKLTRTSAITPESSISVKLAGHNIIVLLPLAFIKRCTNRHYCIKQKKPVSVYCEFELV